VGGEARGQVPDAVAERAGVGVAGFGLAGVPEDAGPGGETGGDVRRGGPGALLQVTAPAALQSLRLSQVLTRRRQRRNSKRYSNSIRG
jgi:hypothetical protein